MKTYKIENKISGVELGELNAKNEQDALNQLAKEAGYNDFSEIPNAEIEELHIAELPKVSRYALKIQVQKSLTSQFFSHYRINEHVITAENDYNALGRVHEIIAMEKSMKSTLAVEFLSLHKLIGE